MQKYNGNIECHSYIQIKHPIMRFIVKICGGHIFRWKMNCLTNK